MRRLIAVLTLAIALLGLGALPAVAGGPNNVVFSDATADAGGAATFDTHSSMVVGATGTDEVSSANVARAVAHDCTGCQAVAVAFQAVLMTGNPRTVAPRNIAFANNVRCNGCAAFAFAFQYVVSTGGPARLSPAGMQGIQALRQEVADDLATDLTPEDLNARLTDIGHRFQALVDNEIVRTGGRPHDREMREQFDRTPAGA
jgi:putative peptide zinc metalloprotease protein